MWSLAFWLFTGLIHIFYIDGFRKFIDSQDGSECYCDYIEILPLPKNADADTLKAYEIATEDRKAACDY